MDDPRKLPANTSIDATKIIGLSVHDIAYDYIPASNFKKLDTEYLVKCPVHPFVGDENPAGIVTLREIRAGKVPCKLCPQNGVDASIKKRFTEKDFHDLVGRQINEHGNVITFDGKLSGVKTVVNFECGIHYGSTTPTTIESIRAGRTPCRTCITNIKMGRPKGYIAPEKAVIKKETCRDKSIESRRKVFMDRCKILYGDTIDLSEVNYVNKNKPVTVTCITHNKKVEKSPENILDGAWCQDCNPAIKQTVGRFAAEYPQFEAEYSAKNTKPFAILPRSNMGFLWNCPVGHEYTSSPMRRAKGLGCTECHKANAASAVTIPEIVAAWSPRNIRKPVDYSAGSGYHVWFVVDGQDMLLRISDFIKGTRASTHTPSILDAHPGIDEWWSTANNFKPGEIRASVADVIELRCKNGHLFKMPATIIPVEITCDKCSQPAQKPRRRVADFKGRVEGECFKDSRGIAYIVSGGQCRKACVECEKALRIDGGDKCGVHSGKRHYTKDTTTLTRGQIVIIEGGERRKFNGLQLVKLCSQGCDNTVASGGLCIRHSPERRCKYSAESCPRIGVTTEGYCRRHDGNTLNKRARSKGENIIAEILLEMGEKFTEQAYVRAAGKQMYLDFFVDSRSVAIEFDGKQHFEAIDFWGGEAGLDKRIESDAAKNDWCIRNGISLLRIHHKDADIRGMIIKFFEQSEKKVYCGASYPVELGYTPIG